MRHLRTPLRVLVGLFAVAALLRPAALTAEDEPSSPYFAARLSDEWTLIERIAAGPDGTVFVCGKSDGLKLPGAIDPPAEGTEFFSGFAFVALIERDGRVRWTRYLDPGWFDGICVAPDGAVWTVASRDDWSGSSTGVRVTKLGANGAVLVNVELVGGRGEQAAGIALTPDGDAVVVGTTNSADFPTVNAFQPQSGGDLDGFVARIAGDGSGVVWSTYLGGPGRDDATAVAVDAAGDVLVATRRRADGWSELYHVDYGTSVTSVALVRLSGDGVPKSTLELPAGDFGGAFSVAVAPDGRFLVGGFIGFTDRGPYEGYVLPVDPVTSAIGVPWHEPWIEVHRIAFGPDGSLLLATDRNWADYPWSSRWVGGGFVHLSADLGSVLRRVDREEFWGVLDAALASDGAICLVGRGSGVIPLFHESGALDSSREWNFDTGFVARLPASGPSPPRRVRVVGTTQTEALISWKSGDDPPVALQLETEEVSQYFGIRLYRVIQRAPAGAHSMRIRGLTPGASHDLRLVAEFASGERVAVRLPAVKTPPAPVRSIQARRDEVRGFNVHWDCGDFGDRTGFELQRSVGGGSYEPVEGYYGMTRGYEPPTRFYDKRISSGDGVVVYRVRAVTRSPRAVTPWRYTFPMFVK